MHPLYSAISNDELSREILKALFVFYDKCEIYVYCLQLRQIQGKIYQYRKLTAQSVALERKGKCYVLDIFCVVGAFK